MRKSIRLIGIGLMGVIVMIQFFQPDRNLGSNGTEGDLVKVTSPSDSLVAILKNSCYDCHSNRTNYPWYSYISPVSWYLEKHITDGKEELNLSKFGDLEKNQEIGVLADICDVVESGSMPLKSYLFVHRHAQLNEAEVEAICNWTEVAALRIMMEQD